MVLKTRKKLKPKAQESAPKVLTLAEIRDQYEPGSFELAAAELTEYLRTADVAREYGNASNRQGTVAKNAVKAYVAAADLKPTDEIHIGEKAFRYDVAYAEKISARELYAMVKAKKITEEQFLSVISVQKGPAGHLIGAHVLASITNTEPGKEFDIRKADLDTPVTEPKLVRKSSPPRSKGKLNKEIEVAPGKVGGAIKLKKLRKISLR